MKVPYEFLSLTQQIISRNGCERLFELNSKSLGKDVIKQGRVMLGETNPLASLPGSIRGDFSIDIGRNIIHGSDSADSAAKEIALWFKEGVVSWDCGEDKYIYE